MDLNDLTAISPIDGRYRRVGKLVAPYFSEFALIKYRVQVEIEYFIALCELPVPQLQNVADTEYNNLRQIYLEFSLADASRIKEIERTYLFCDRGFWHLARYTTLFVAAAAQNAHASNTSCSCRRCLLLMIAIRMSLVTR